MKDYYNILGIKKSASEEEIRKAYRNLALQFHPDKNANNNHTEIFKDINEAKQVLLNDARRREYDSLFIEPKRTGALFGSLRQKPQAGKPAFKQKPFIKQNTGKKIVLATSLSCFFVLAIVFFFKINEVEQPSGLVTYNKNVADGKKADQNPEASEVASKTEGNISYEQKRSGAEDATANSDKEQVSAAGTGADTKEKVANPVVAETAKINEEAVPANGSEAKAISVNEKVTEQKKPEKTSAKKVSLLSKADMEKIFNDIKIEKLRSGSNTKCVQIRKTKNSNVENGFMLAGFLQTKGYIISGREIVSATVKKVQIESNDGCVKVIIGTFE